MRVVVAPDSFKGSLMSWDVVRAVADGIRAAVPGAEIVELPLGDGGEGTARALAHAVPGSRMIQAEALDPLGRPVLACFAFLPPATAVVEMAAASGLSLLGPGERAPMRATTYGTGQLLRAALDLLLGPGERPRAAAPPPAGATIILGVGGSATVDGGIGMVSALGGRFVGPHGEDLGRGGGGDLLKVETVDLSGLDPRIHEVDMVLASDVNNPLLGEHGAAAVFGPQKGATPEQVVLLERGLCHLREVVLAQTGREMDGFPGGGAAGGVGAAAVAILGARARSGIEIALEAAGFDRVARDADLVITGEGRYDLQTLSGKAVFGVAAAAARQGIPVCVLAGSLEAGAEWRLPGRCVVFPVADGPMSLAESEARVRELVSAAARRVTMLFLAGQGPQSESPPSVGASISRAERD